jgi:hypothetical protein
MSVPRANYNIHCCAAAVLQHRFYTYFTFMFKHVNVQFLIAMEDSSEFHKICIIIPVLLLTFDTHNIFPDIMLLQFHSLVQQVIQFIYYLV